MKMVFDLFPKFFFTNFQALWRALVNSQLSNEPRMSWLCFSCVSSYVLHSVVYAVDTVSDCALITILHAAFTSLVCRTLVLKAFRGGRMAEPALLHISTWSLYKLVWVFNASSAKK